MAIEITNGARITKNPINPLYPLQLFNVSKCGTTNIVGQLAIDVGVTLSVGMAVRPTIRPGVNTNLPGYEAGVCYELVSAASNGTYCGTRAPAASCAESVCL
jgi:hypothetical protein